MEYLPTSHQTAVEPLEWTVGEGSGLWLMWYHWIFAKYILLSFLKYIFPDYLFQSQEKKNSKFFPRRGVVAPFQDWPLCLLGSCCNECCPTFTKPSPFRSSKIFIHLPLSSRDCQAVDVAEPIEWQCSFKTPKYLKTSSVGSSLVLEPGFE